MNLCVVFIQIFILGGDQFSGKCNLFTRLLPSNACVKVFEKDGDITFLPDEGIVLTGQNVIKITTVGDYPWKQKWLPTNRYARKLLSSPNGEWLILQTAEGKIGLWHIPTQAQLFQLKLDSYSAEVVFSPSGGEWVLYSTEQTYIYSVEGELLATLPQTEYAAYSPDGATLWLGVGNTLTVWDVETWSQQGSFMLDETIYATLLDLVFSPNSTVVALVLQDGVVLMDANTGENIKKWEGLNVNHWGHLSQITPDGEWLIVPSGGDRHGLLLVLPVVAGHEVFEVEVTDGDEVQSMAVSPDGRYLGVVDYDRTMIFDLPKLLEQAQE